MSKTPAPAAPDFQLHGIFVTYDANVKAILPKIHRHNEIELNFLESGRLTYELGGRTLPVPVRALSVFWGGNPHRCVEWAPDGKIWTLSIPLGIFLSWGLPRETFVHPLLKGDILHERDPGVADFDETLMRRWCADIHFAAPADRHLQREALLLEARARLLRLALRAGNVRGRRRLAAEPGCVGKMLQHIAARHTDPALNIGEIARHAGVNPTYAVDVFKKTCGVTPMRYVCQQRIAHAQRLLATTDAKILDIALDSGFGSVSQFHHVFHAATGVTPREYAQTHVAKPNSK